MYSIDGILNPSARNQVIPEISQSVKQQQRLTEEKPTGRDAFKV